MRSVWRWLMGLCVECGELRIHSPTMGNWCGCNSRSSVKLPPIGGTMRETNEGARPDTAPDAQRHNYAHPDALVHQVGEAIKLAAKLGDDAFDFIEGRGLHAMRLQIEKDVAALRAQAAQSPRSAPPCKYCNDEGVVHTHDGDVIGPCACASSPPDSAPTMKDLGDGAADAAQLLEAVACSGVEFDDPRLDYIVVQIDRDVWDDIRAAKSLRASEAQHAKESASQLTAALGEPSEEEVAIVVHKLDIAEVATDDEMTRGVVRRVLTAFLQKRREAR